MWIFDQIEKIANYLFGSATEREIRRQERMLAIYERYEAQRRREYERVYERYNSRREEIDEENQRLWEKYIDEKKEEFRERNRGSYQEIIDIYEKQYTDKEKMKKSLKNLLEEFRENMKEQQNTYIRYNSLKVTEYSLEEAYYKLEGYLYYLKFYRKDLENQFNEMGRLLPPFSILMPENAPFIGKLYYFKKSDFSKYEITLEGLNIKLALPKIEREIFDLEESETELPFMVYRQLNDNPVAFLSLSKGKLKAIMGTGEGIIAEVNRVESYCVFLSNGSERRLRL